MASVGAEADGDKLGKLMEQLSGKDIAEVIAAGSEKLASVPAGGAVAAGGAAGGSAAAAEEKKEESEEEESDDVSDFGRVLLPQPPAEDAWGRVIPCPLRPNCKAQPPPWRSADSLFLSL